MLKMNAASYTITAESHYKLIVMKKRSEEMQTLHTRCSKAEPKFTVPPQIPSQGHGMAKI